MRGLRMAWIVALGVGPGTAVADSDGYYCHGPGYLAYETRVSTPTTSHELHVVRYSRQAGIVRFPPVALAEFQVHGMWCGETAVELTDGSTRYRVDLTEPQHPTVTAERGAPLSGPGAAENLGLWGSEGVVDLMSDALPGEFQLVVSRVSRTLPAGLEHYTVSLIIRRDPEPGGFVLASHELFAGVFLETVD